MHPSGPSRLRSPAKLHQPQSRLPPKCSPVARALQTGLPSQSSQVAFACLTKMLPKSSQVSSDQFASEVRPSCFHLADLVTSEARDLTKFHSPCVPGGLRRLACVHCGPGDFTLRTRWLPKSSEVWLPKTLRTSGAPPPDLAASEV